MKDYHLSEAVSLESGIYMHAYGKLNHIDRATRRKTLKKRLFRKLRSEHFLASKIKIALCLFVIVAVLSKLLVG